MATNSQTHLVDTADGRRLRVEIAGDSDRVILAHLGTPNAGVLFEPWVRDALTRSLSLVTYDRPGYRGSSSQPGRIIADCVDDVRAIATSLGFTRCAVWGFSGGGPHALACAALPGDLVAAVATIGSPAPPDAAGLDYFAGMSDETRQDIELLRTDRPEWARISVEQREALLALTATELVESWSERKATIDGAAMRSEFGGWLYRAVQDGMATSIDGVLDDNVAIFQPPWGFEVTSISTPVKVWHGARDGFVPCAHGRWLVAQIPGAEADLNDRDGHMTVVAERIGDVHAWLARYL
jgi:pimeloyl-ACP methyl ester carboxylesterase